MRTNHFRGFELDVYELIQLSAPRHGAAKWPRGGQRVGPRQGVALLSCPRYPTSNRERASLPNVNGLGPVEASSAARSFRRRLLAELGRLRASRTAKSKMATDQSPPKARV
jgi:hypothetical protein